MRISYVSTYDAKEIHNWSGLGYFIAKTLEEQNLDLNYIGNLKAHKSYQMLLKKGFFKMIGKTYDYQREPEISRNYAHEIKSRLNKRTDVIFSPGSIPIAMLDINKPKVFYTDATFAGMLGFYKEFSSICSETIRNGNFLEKRALETSSLAIYSSDWAAKTAIENYDANPEKIKVVPFGANIECTRTLETIKNIVRIKSSNKCQLLFLGIDWARKGGPLAVDVAEALNKRGLPTTLHVAGIQNLSRYNLPKFVIDHGFISKKTKEGVDSLDQLLSESHFLILPSRAEAFGVVFCEANSFGLPCLATNVGGIPTIIKEDLNGKTFSLSNDANDYADYIELHFQNYFNYEKLSLSSFNEYSSRLNWSVSGKKIKNYLEEL